MLSGMFDSNVYKKVSDPPQGDPSFSAYVRINSAIKSGELRAFIAETIFTLEGIQRTNRRKIIGSQKGKLTAQEAIIENTIATSFAFGPERGKGFGDNDQLRHHFTKALAAGLNIVRLPRIAGFILMKKSSHIYFGSMGIN